MFRKSPKAVLPQSPETAVAMFASDETQADSEDSSSTIVAQENGATSDLAADTDPAEESESLRSDSPPENPAQTDLHSAVTPPPSPSPKSPSKRSLVLDLLRREDGATLPELCTATGWQAHSVRAVLTGLRKRGSVLEKSIRNGATCYQIPDASGA